MLLASTRLTPIETKVGITSNLIWRDICGTERENRSVPNAQADQTCLGQPWENPYAPTGWSSIQLVHERLVGNNAQYSTIDKCSGLVAAISSLSLCLMLAANHEISRTFPDWIETVVIAGTCFAHLIKLSRLLFTGYFRRWSRWRLIRAFICSNPANP